jgi:hypothetical protein
MGGSWDFTVSGGSGNLVGLEAFMDQDVTGNLSANTTISSLCGTGQATNGVVFEADVLGSSLSNGGQNRARSLIMCGTPSAA